MTVTPMRPESTGAETRHQRCLGCRVVKPVAQFRPNATMRSGYLATCKECVNAERRARRETGAVSTPGGREARAAAAEAREMAEMRRQRATSGEALDALLRRYAPGPVPPCRVCGGPLKPRAQFGEDTVQYACGNTTEADLAEFLAPGGHHARSLWRQTRPGDPAVVALVEHLKAEGVAEAAQATQVLAEALGFPHDPEFGYVTWPLGPVGVAERAVQALRVTREGAA